MSLSHITLALYLIVVGVVALTDVTIDGRVPAVIALIAGVLIILEATVLTWRLPKIKK